MRNRHGYGYASIGRGHCPLNPYFPIFQSPIMYTEKETCI